MLFVVRQSKANARRLLVVVFIGLLVVVAWCTTSQQIMLWRRLITWRPSPFVAGLWFVHEPTNAITADRILYYCGMDYGFLASHVTSLISTTSYSSSTSSSRRVGGSILCCLLFAVCRLRDADMRHADCRLTNATLR